MAARKIWTTRDICTECANRYNLLNTNQIAHKFGVTFGTVRNWERGGIMDESQVKTAAALLDEDPAWLLACVLLERVRDDNLSAGFRSILQTWAGLAASVFAVIFVELGAQAIAVDFV